MGRRRRAGGGSEGMVAFAGSRTEANQAGRPCGLEILSYGEIVGVIPVSERRNLPTSFTYLFIHKQTYTRS